MHILKVNHTFIESRIMPVKLVLGLQHGDEGKGRVVDDLVQTWADVVVRFQGGGNAGHTVYDEEGNPRTVLFADD